MANAKKNQAPKATVKTKKEAEAEVKQEPIKNPQEYSYRGDEKITISASLFLALYRANDAALKQGTKGNYPTAFEWVNSATGMPVPNPREADIKQGIVTQVLSIQKTFKDSNYAESYEPWLFPDVIQAKDEMLKVHINNVNEGIAVPIADLQKEAKERQEAQAKMREEAEKAAQAKK